MAIIYRFWTYNPWITWCFTQVGTLACILIGMATLFANNTPHGENWAPGIPGSPCYTRGPTRGPTKAIPGGPPGGPLRVLNSYFCRGMTHEIIIYNRYLRSEIGNVCSITFLSERTVLCFLLSEDDNFVSLIGQSYCSYLSNW